jgi:hypothetical protein
MIVCRASEIEFSKLRITRAYIKLLCIPEGAAKIVSLARLGNYEVRMLESLQNSSDAVPLFSLELFDHDAQSPVDSHSCCSTDEGAAAFRDFISR